MCIRSITSLRQLILLTCLTIIGFSVYSSSKAVSNDFNKNISTNISPFYETSKEIDGFFSSQNILVETKTLTNNFTEYYFVTAHPYSGMDTTDLYCFVKRGSGWAMFLKAFLWKEPFGKEITFKPDGEFINVICKDKTVLKLNPQT